MGGAGPGPSQKAGRFSGPLHGWNGHGRSLVPSTGGAGTAGSLVPSTGERGLEEERCAAAGERRGQRRREMLIGVDQDQDFFFCCDSLVFSNKKFCLWFSLAGIAEETKS